MLKIIYLNTWFGKVEKLFREYVIENSVSTDIFCFSEVSDGEANLSFGGLEGLRPVGKEFEQLVGEGSSNSFSQLKTMLPGFEGKFDGSSYLKTEDGKIFPMGLAYFVKKGITVEKAGVADVNKGAADDPEEYERIIQFFCVNINGKKIWMNNFHGISHPGEKLDTKDRLSQSKNICKVLKNQPGLKILGGDFNLMPGTKSVKIIEESGLKNLITDYKIKSTRSALNHSQYPNRVKQYYADFVFVSPEITVKSFEAPNLNISDHLPLVLEIET
ncbi:MAG: hypothetical protein WC725_03135 [Patescibacteria group bacterium]|jgi:hypothetical protein